MVSDVDQKIKDLFNKMESDPSIFADTLKNNFLNGLKEEEKIEYLNFEQILTKLKQEIEQKISSPLLAEKIKEVKETGQDKLIIDAEDLLRKDVPIFMERQIVIINVLRKIINQEIKLSNLEPNFDKYSLANFYRSYCELSPRIMSNLVYEIINYLLNDDTINTNTKKKIDSIKSNFNNKKLGLSDIRNVFIYYDKNKVIGISELMDNVFLFKEGEGFSLRNKVAHDRSLFIEIDNNLLIDEILKINRFLWAFLFIFYLKDIGKFCRIEDLNLSKNLLNFR